MRVLVNCLSIGSLSGQHVVYGFMSQITKWCENDHEFVFLHYEPSPPPPTVIRANTTNLAVGDHVGHWLRRTAWEQFQLPRIVREQGIDLVVCPSGGVTSTVREPQVVLAQNPWCFVKKVHQGVSQHAKAFAQRRAYKRAFCSADLMVYLSDYLRSLYRNHAGAKQEGASEVAHVALDDETHTSADRLRNEIPKQDNVILSVSAMARWKGAGTLVAALRRLRDSGVDAQLRLVGPWPDVGYQREIHGLVTRENLSPYVEITGKVTRDELHRHYAEAKVFALMSHCESFGIPAAEAQLFGTPSVVSRNCAMPEVCGEGGVYGEADDVEWTTQALAKMLTDVPHWQQYSVAAMANSRQYRWEQCARPLMSMFTLA